MDYELPQASINRIIKNKLPESAQVGKEAKTAFSKAAGIFILYLTAAANDFCKEAGVRLCTEDELCSRKTGVHIKDDENLTDADRQTRWGEGCLLPGRLCLLNREHGAGD